jgi:predicted O-methyltransferase YrrM
MKSHRTPRYVYHRTKQLLYERRHPEAPWLTPGAVRLLGSLLRPCDWGVEFGSGRSTTWFARRVAHLTSVEHDPQWYASVRDALAERGLANVDHVLAPWVADLPGDQSDYAGVLRRFGEQSLDFALIDGTYREHTARLTLPRIKPGGLLIIDNVNWYLPSGSRAPASRSLAMGPEAGWDDIAKELAGWRSIWIGSGVWDTAIFIRP